MSDGLRLLQEGDKALASASGGFSFFSNKESKMQDASESYVAAAQAFRMTEKFAESGRAYEKAAYVHGGDGRNKMLNEPDDAARYNDDASKQYRIAGMVEDAKRTLDHAATHWNKKNNPTRAAQARGTLGDWLANEAQDYQGAAKEFNQAAGLLGLGSNTRAMEVKWTAREAEMLVLTGNFEAAADKYANLVRTTEKHDTMKYSAKNYLYTKWICKLALAPDKVRAQGILEELQQNEHNGVTHLQISKDLRMLVAGLCAALLPGEPEEPDVPGSRSVREALYARYCTNRAAQGNSGQDNDQDAEDTPKKGEPVGGALWQLVNTPYFTGKLDAYQRAAFEAAKTLVINAESAPAEGGMGAPDDHHYDDFA